MCRASSSRATRITRDKVIRRELLLEEGQVYNSRLWELSILRLNQLNYFEPLKVEQDSESRQNTDDGTVDLLLKLKEKGKNSIGLNGGLSGLSGSFIGLNYETNNFLGLGETLSVQANIGDLQRNLSFGFTEPYFRNKPISLGIQVFTSKYDFNPAKGYSIANNLSQNLSTAQQSLLTNYNQSQTGLTLSVSSPLRHLFSRSGVTRVGVSYALSRSSVTTFNDNTRNVFQTLAFRSGVQGQNQLNGIISSVVTPSFTFSSLDRAVGPHSGKDLNAALAIAGAGGNVKYIQPVVSWRQFFPMNKLKVSREGHNVLGYRLQFSHIVGFGGEVAPPQNRVYSGGEMDVRGFDVRSTSPYTFIPTQVKFNLTNPDGTVVPRDPSNPSLGNVQIPLPIYRLVSIGGDTAVTGNIEYRIPIINQVTFAFFTDFNMTFDVYPKSASPERLRSAGDLKPDVWLPELHQRRLLRWQAAHLPQSASHCAGNQLRSTYVERCRGSGHSSDRERSVPYLLCVQPASPLQGRSAGAGDGRCDLPRLLPQLRSRSVHLSPGPAALWVALYAARAQKDLPASPSAQPSKTCTCQRFFPLLLPLPLRPPPSGGAFLFSCRSKARSEDVLLQRVFVEAIGKGSQ